MASNQKLNPNSAKRNQRIVATGNFAACIFTYKSYNDNFELDGNSYEVIVGGGIRQASISQDFASEAVAGLGHTDVIYADSGVRGTTMQFTKVMMLPTQLTGQLTGFGIDNWELPNVTCRIFDSGWEQQGKPITFVEAVGLHLVRNGLEFNAQAANMENVSFNVDRLRRPKNQTQAKVLLEAFKKNFEELYSLTTGYQPFSGEGYIIQ
jgi:hypothetical protein